MSVENFIQKISEWNHSSWRNGHLLEYWKRGEITPEKIIENKKLLVGQSSPIAILGSVGKTTLSKLLVALFRSNDKKCYDPKINDNWVPQLPFAVELARVSLAQYPIFECGVARKGDASLMGQIVPSELTIFTPFESVHVGYLGNLKDIASEKFSFINTSNPKKVLIHESNRKFSGGIDNAQFYGGSSSVFLGEIKFLSESGTEIEISGQGKKTFFIPEGGYHLKTAFEGALEIYSNLTSSQLEDIVFDPTKYNPPVQRMQRVHQGDNTFIVDTANANGLSIVNSLESFVALKSKKRKRIILGEVYGMGEEAREIMERLIKKISSMDYRDIEEIVFLGEHYRKHLEDLQGITPQTSFYNSQEEFENSNQMKSFPPSLILLRGPTKRGRNLSSLIDGYCCESDETHPENIIR